MKRFYILIGMLILLAACSGDAEPETSASPTQASSLTNTPVPTNTRIVQPTLPPVATLALDEPTTAPTNTRLPTITPAPSSTSNLNPNVTPVDAAQTEENTPIPTADSEGNITAPQLIISYSEITRILREYDPPRTTDLLMKGTERVDLDAERGIVILTFDVETNQGVYNITADIEFTFLNQQVFPAFSRVYFTQNPSLTYDSDLIAPLTRDFERAFLQGITDMMLREVGALYPFAITDFSVSSAGIDVKTIIDN